MNMMNELLNLYNYHIIIIKINIIKIILINTSILARIFIFGDILK